MWLYWLFSQCIVTFLFQFFKFYLSAMPYLPPATLSELRPSLILLHATLFPTFSGPTSGQRASSWSRGLYIHSIITYAAIFLSIMAYIIVLIERSTRGISIDHAPRTRPVTPIRVWNLPKAGNHPPNRSLGSHPLQVWTGTWASFLILCKQQLLRLNFLKTPPSEASN
jgi:hypothetical protein